MSDIFTPNIPQPVTIGRVTACPLPKGGLIRNWLRFFLGILDKGALQGILKPACLFFPGNNACNDTGKGKEKKHYFAEGAELCYKNILPKYFHISRRGIKRKFDFSADFFQGSMAIPGATGAPSNFRLAGATLLFSYNLPYNFLAQKLKYEKWGPDILKIE